MMTYGHGDEVYVHYALDLCHDDCNHAVGSFAIFLRDLKEPQHLHHVSFFMLSDGHLFIVLFCMGVICVCKDNQLHLCGMSQLFLLHPFCMFNSTNVERTTNVGS